MTLPTTPPPPAGRLAGIDYGTVRIGVAITDSEQKFISPLETYTRKGPQGDTKYFQQLAKEERIVLFVVGLPVHLDGGESAKSVESRKFGEWLGQTTRVPVVFFDERFTTSEARELLHGAELTRKKRKAKIDKLAAQLLLTAYLEARERPQQNLAGLE